MTQVPDDFLPMRKTKLWKKTVKKDEGYKPLTPNFCPLVHPDTEKKCGNFMRSWDIMFYDQDKGQEINGEFHKGSITDEFGGLPGNEGTPGFLGTLKKNRGLAFIQRSGSYGLAFWLGCRGLRDANGSVSYAKKQKKHSNMLEIGGGQQWLTGTAHYSSSAFYTGEDLESLNKQLNSHKTYKGYVFDKLTLLFFQCLTQKHIQCIFLSQYYNFVKHMDLPFHNLEFLTIDFLHLF